MKGLLPIHPHLVRDSEDRQALETFRGQASFAGSGPTGKVCGQCRHWLGLRHSKSAICVEHKRLMSGREGPKIPANAGACKYFDEAGAR
jgi:hypothetical protein